MNQDVGFLEQVSEKIASLRTAQVGRHATLVGIKVNEKPALFGIGLVIGKWAATSRQITAGRLDLDHFRTEVGNHLSAERRRHPLAAFDHSESREPARVLGCTHAS